jgi:Domain of unknown function (DUF4384)
MLIALGWMLLAGSASPAAAPPTGPGLPRPALWRHGHPPARVSVWTDREGPYSRGERARVYVSAEGPTYLTVIRVDTDGRVRVLFPREPWADGRIRGGHAVEASAADGGGFAVDDDPGVGYLFAVGSPRPFDYTDLARGDYWDYRLIDDGRIEGDPYVALTALADRISPDRDYDYDLAPYYVDRRYAYPRFACYDCHSYASYDEWDPYGAECARYRLEIYDDPSYYPYRYNRGRNVVADRPARAAPRFVFREADPTRPYITRRRGRPPEGESGRPAGVGDRVLPAPAAGLTRRRAPAADSAPGGFTRRRGTFDGVIPRGLAPSQRPPRSTGEPELRRRKP